MGLPTILFLIFMALKLAGFITWSWWLVFLPLIIEALFDIVVVGLFGGAILAGIRRRKAHKQALNRSPGRL